MKSTELAPEETTTELATFTSLDLHNMANIKSQKKRIITNEKRRQANVSVRTSMRTAIKAVEAAIANKDHAAAVEAYNIANKRLDKAVVKGIIHKNFAARNKSRLSKSINELQG